MLLATSKSFSDFELLDTGEGQRLEKWGPRLLIRPEGQIIWPQSLPRLWQKADAVFVGGSEKANGRWEIKTKNFSPWTINYQGLKFLLKLSPFKHTGIFPEQAAQWEWMEEKLKFKNQNEKFYNPTSPPQKSEATTLFSPLGGDVRRTERVIRGGRERLSQSLRILNLFAYTGGATMLLTKLGCFVTHVDASKPALLWAKENQKLNTLPENGIRWILDDAVKFAARELKRGQRYDGILMDPPAFGHSPSGKTWKFNQDLPRLLETCVKLLSPGARFLVINGYATNSSALALNNLLEDAVRSRPGNIEFGELCLKQKNRRMISTGIFARWSGKI